MDSFVPTAILWPLVFISPTVVIFIIFLLQRDKTDACKAVLSLTLGLCLTGVITNIIKLIVGRPRPDFFWRCFPDGKINSDLHCTGEQSVINDGRKSFPSGHSSFSFASMGFIALYLAGKLHIFNARGRGKSWRLCLVLTPLVIALCVAMSRTCDYHHHWQDFYAGATIEKYLLGLHRSSAHQFVNFYSRRSLWLWPWALSCLSVLSSVLSFSRIRLLPPATCCHNLTDRAEHCEKFASRRTGQVDMILVYIYLLITGI